MAPKDLVPLLVYVPPDTKRQLEEIAGREERSVSFVARRLLVGIVASTPTNGGAMPEERREQEQQTTTTRTTETREQPDQAKQGDQQGQQGDGGQGGSESK